MKLLGSKSSAVIGIDIAADSIKLVEVGGSSGRQKVLSWGQAATPPKSFVENVIVDADMLAAALQELILTSGTRSEDVAVAISSTHAITKVLSMPAGVSDVELEEQVSIEALHFVPYPIDEVNIDFEVIGPSSTKPDDENDVLLVACRRSIVDDYIDLIETLGLNLRYVDIDTYALERTCRNHVHSFENVKNPIALFDMGAESSHLMLLDEERVIYSRHQSFGGNQLIKLIRKAYGVSADEAKGILESAQLPADFAANVQTKFVDQLDQEIRRALQFFYSSSPFAEVDSVVLSGRPAALEGLAHDVGESLRARTSVLNPFENARVMRQRSEATVHAPSMATAFGLSLRGIS